jgi:3-oxoacyl-[acyl-carrier protein] reductase
MVVVGGCGGVGSALVRAALDNELRVAVLDLPRSLDEHPPPPSVETWPLDATREEDVERAFGAVEARWGGLDCAVNLAGAWRGFGSVEELSERSFWEVMRASLGTTLLGCRAAVPLMRRSGGGAIVNLSSSLAYVGEAGYAPHATARSGIVALTRTLAAENAPLVRVNAVAPGVTATAYLSQTGDRRRGAQEYVSRIPLGRPVSPDDVVGPILFLASDAARYITGQTLHLNGGTLMP